MNLYDYHGKYNCSGARICDRRKELKLSQEQLAAKLQLAGLEISQRAISRVENGLRVVPDFELKYFADALEVSPLWLLGCHDKAGG